MQFLKNFDKLTRPQVEVTVFGGFLTVVGYVCVLVYCIVYVISVREKSYPTTLTIGPFPDETSPMTLSPMNCVATSGCYIAPQSMMMPVCTFLEQGEALPDNLRTIFYTSDTTNLFTVLSTDSSENFALSYDVTYVTKHTDPIETETLKAAVDFSPQVPMPYKIRRGISLFNLIRTKEVDEGHVDTWLNTVTTETSQFSGSGGCCDVNVYDVEGNLLTTQTNLMTQCSANSNNWWTTKLQPPASYSTIQVEDPIHPFTILALYGGWTVFMMMIVSTIFYGSDFLRKRQAREADPATQKEVEREIEM